ncbi:hypothetical protein Cni_G04923 [Canna indica]|uniref:Uncharacterized protein n=1 Tax=Canna indica TaxID=4628 RepID=A0AAQ3JUA1_9LILI|nr:hypothetical protein Cni_G04923 [Canna indica]
MGQGDSGESVRRASKRKTPFSLEEAVVAPRTPEEIVDERHSKGLSQQTIENSLKTKEAIEKVNMYVANFFYENVIPFNAANSRSYELMVEGIAQIGSGYKPPTYHELRVPLLKKAKEQTCNSCL